MELHAWPPDSNVVCREKSETGDELFRRVVGFAAFVRNSHQITCKVTRAVLIRTRMCISSTGGHFEGKAAKVRALWHNVR